MLMRCICGLVIPDNGAIIVDGDELGKRISFPESLGALIESPGFIEHYSALDNIMVTVNIKNMSEEKQRVTLEGFTLTSQAWTTCTAPDKYMAVNEKWNSEQYQSGSIYIESGEERKLILPFLLVKNGFTQKQWEHVKERNYELVLSLYPVKKQIKLKCV